MTDRDAGDEDDRDERVRAVYRQIEDGLARMLVPFTPMRLDAAAFDYWLLVPSVRYFVVKATIREPEHDPGDEHITADPWLRLSTGEDTLVEVPSTR